MNVTEYGIVEHRNGTDYYVSNFQAPPPISIGPGKPDFVYHASPHVGFAWRFATTDAAEQQAKDFTMANPGRSFRVVELEGDK